MAVADEAIEKLKAMIVSGELRPTLANPSGDVIVSRTRRWVASRMLEVHAGHGLPGRD